MKEIPVTDMPLIIRTDFSDQAEWENICESVQEPTEFFEFNMEFLDKRDYDGAKKGQLLKAVPEDYPHGFMVVADGAAISQPEHPLLVVDLLDKPGHEFRALASQLQSIENNLSTGNMSFEEFAASVDDTGVFRGFPDEE
jgi:hypothetical protein